MPARLFRRIQSFFSRLNKTALLVAAVLFAAIAIHSTPVFALNESDLKANYVAWSSLFTPTSGITDIGVQKSTTNNDAIGLVLSLNLNLQPFNSESLDSAWNRIASYQNDIFVSELCLDSNTTKCWLSGLPLTEGTADGTNNLIFKKDSSGNAASAETLAVTAFSNTSGYTDTITTGGVTSFGTTATPTTYTNTNGGDLHTYNPTTNIASTIGNLVLPKGQSLTATLWYCADGDGAKAVDAYVANKVSITNPRKFGSLCKGASYFQIGGPQSITIAADAAGLQQQVQAGQTAVAKQSITTSTDSNLPTCGIGILGSSGTINGCAARIAYGIYYLTELIAALFGKLFDFFIGYSVSDTSYRYGFAVTGWRLVRDISNIFFIIIMIWTGFSAVFDTTNTSMKKVVPALIVNALLINFSLFATRVVIDISNITARMFYSQMLVCEEVNKDSSGHCIPGKTKTGTGGYWPLSEAIVGAFNPQKIFQASILQQSTTVSGDTATDFNAQDVTQNKTKLSATDSADYFAAICLVGAFIMVVVTIMFFKVTFLFVGRVVGLYICMIFSPFAFLSRDIPMLGGIERLRWGDWVKELTNYALLAPIFIFFLYIIYILLSSNFAQEIGKTILSPGATNVFELIISTAVPMAIIYFLLQAAQKTAEKYAGEIGKSIQGFGTQVTGLALGAATGGAALMGGRVVGGLAKRVDESRVGVGIRNLAAKGGVGGWTGKKLQQGLNTTRSGSFDVRQTTVGKSFFNKLGINTDQKGLNALAGVGLGLGVDQRKGGFDADVKRRQENDLKDEKLLEEKDGAGIKAYNERNKKKYDEKINEIVETAMRTAGHSQVDIDNAKEARKDPNNPAHTNYETWKNTALQTTAVQTNVNTVPPPKQVTSADELTRTRRKQFKEGLAKGGVFTQARDWAVKNAEEKGGAWNILGASAELLSATAGAAVGSQVRTDGSRKAAKKIDEKTKAEKELQDIEETLKNGFRDLIALEKFQTSTSFTALSKEEKQDLLNLGVIRQPGANNGKKIYDILTVNEQSAVEAEQKVMNADKDSKERWEKRVQAVEQNRYDTNGLKKQLTEVKKDIATATTAAARDAAQAEYFEVYAKIEAAAKHNKIWNDIVKYQEDQKKKLKDEDSK